MLFTVNSVDFTSYIVSPSYKVNKQDTFETWVDGNGISHRAIYRTKISGTFEIKFVSPTKYSNFLTALSAVKTNGYYPVTLYVNNTLASETINAFVTIEPAMTAQYSSGPEVEKFTVKVEQI